MSACYVCWRQDAAHSIHEEEDDESLVLEDGKWGWPALALVAVLAVGGVTTGFGLTKGAQSPLWTEQSTVSTTAPTVQAPDWVKIGHELKPAVVNVSTKRTESAMSGDAGPVRRGDPVR